MSKRAIVIFYDGVEIPKSAESTIMNVVCAFTKEGSDMTISLMDQADLANAATTAAMLRQFSGIPMRDEVALGESEAKLEIENSLKKAIIIINSRFGDIFVGDKDINAFASELASRATLARYHHNDSELLECIDVLTNNPDVFKKINSGFKTKYGFTPTVYNTIRKVHDVVIKL